MPFEFPNAPVAGDTHTEFGVDYVYDGAVWNLASGGAMTDYVLKAGDTMTGSLVMQSDPTINYLRLSDGGSPVQGSLIEWFNPDATRKAYLGWGASTELILSLETAVSLNVKGGNIYMQDAGGIHYGNNSAVTSATDFSKGICLYGYGGTSKFGFTITSGTLNYVVESTANLHCFRVGSASKVTISNANGLWTESGVPAKFHGPTSFEAGSHLLMDDTIIYSQRATYDNSSMHHYRHSATDVCQVRGYGSSAEGGVRFHCKGGGYGWNDNWRSDVVSGGGLYVTGQMSAGSIVDRGTADTKRDIRDCIDAEVTASFAALKPKRFIKIIADPVDENGQPLPADQCWPKDERLRFGFVVDDIVANPATKDIAGYSVIPGTNGQQEPIGTDIMQVLALTVAKVKQLEAEIAKVKQLESEIAELRAQPRGGRR